MARVSEVISGERWFAHYHDRDDFDVLPILFFVWHGDTNFNKGEVGSVTGVTLLGNNVLDASSVPGFHGFFRSYSVDSVANITRAKLQELVNDRFNLTDQDLRGLVNHSLSVKLAELIVDRAFRDGLGDALHPEPPTPGGE